MLALQLCARERDRQEITFNLCFAGRMWPLYFPLPFSLGWAEPLPRCYSDIIYAALSSLGGPCLAPMGRHLVPCLEPGFATRLLHSLSYQRGDHTACAIRERFPYQRLPGGVRPIGHGQRACEATLVVRVILSSALRGMPSGVPRGMLLLGDNNLFETSVFGGLLSST